MECVGHAFAMPMEDADIMEKVCFHHMALFYASQALAIYHNWLDRNHRPPPMNDDERPFMEVRTRAYRLLMLQDIFRHFSLLFMPRVTAKMNLMQLARHSALCTAVLEAIASVARRHPIQTETWEVYTWITLIH